MNQTENIKEDAKIDKSEYENIRTKQAYLELFKDKSEVFKLILDIRKFEIELYWKRSTFFWTIIAAIIAGYFLVYSRMNLQEVKTLKILYSLACLGLVYSIGWYFVNRGSKFWQVNWEKHMDCIEDEVIGPLYKTTIDTNYYRTKFLSLLAPFPFSVSKINQVLNIVVIAFWAIMIFDLFNSYLYVSLFVLSNYYSFYSIMGLVTIIAIFSLFAFTQTGIDNYFGDKEKRRKTNINFEKRAVS